MSKSVKTAHGTGNAGKNGHTGEVTANKTEPGNAESDRAGSLGSGTAARNASKPATRVLSSLGLHGLSHLDASVLAALATEATMLLIGPHGSAKSALLERLAGALALEHRHYNASLLSFDDLVGFPVPQGDGLRYLHTPATLWGAQSVFLDEISRCRPEVQNKLFSIIHDKRVQGIALPALRYRWAAMNPPLGDDAPVGDTMLDAYAGSIPLDTALADRFAFVLPLPALDELTPDARRAVIRSGLPYETVPTSQAITPSGGGPANAGVADLVNTCKLLLPWLSGLHAEWITTYTATLVVPLREAGLPISGRRAAMLAGNIAAVHAAHRTLGDERSIDESALVALRHSLPHRAQGRAVDAGVLATIHRHAAQAANEPVGDQALARILDEPHPVRRVGMALAVQAAHPTLLAKATMSALVADALACVEVQSRWILSQELLPTLAKLDCVDAATLELLAEPFIAQVRLESRSNLRTEIPRNQLAPFQALVTALDALDPQKPEDIALGNLGTALFEREEAAAQPARLSAQQAALRNQLQQGASATSDDECEPMARSRYPTSEVISHG
jgi:MoxR-like ATPase